MTNNDREFPSPSLEALRGNIHPVLHSLRDHGPLVWVDDLDAWVVTTRELAIEVLLDDRTFTVDDPRFSTAQVVGPSMLSLDGSDHQRHRTPFATPFRRRPSVNHHGEQIVSTARALAADLPDGPADLRSAIAEPLAVATISQALGLEGVDPGELRSWYRLIVAGVESVSSGGAVTRSSLDAFAALSEAVDRTSRVDGTLMNQIHNTGNLSDEELRSNTAIMLFGAVETSEGMIANAFFHLLRNPSSLRELIADPGLVPAAVEESLRMEPAATLVDRYTTMPVNLAGVSLAERDHISVSLAAANRDPQVFPDPDRFDIHRPNAGSHLSFVHGPHACVGMHLARLETIAAITAVLSECPGLTPTTATPPVPTGLVFRKPDTVVADCRRSVMAPT